MLRRWVKKINSQLHKNRKTSDPLRSSNRTRGRKGEGYNGNGQWQSSVQCLKSAVAHGVIVVGGVVVIVVVVAVVIRPSIHPSIHPLASHIPKLSLLPPTIVMLGFPPFASIDCPTYGHSATTTAREKGKVPSTQAPARYMSVFEIFDRNGMHKTSKFVAKVAFSKR